MGAVKLYKYLDYNGGLMMLYYSNLQFTNATQLNNPFDCHPALIDFSKVPKQACGGWTPEIIEQLRSNSFRRTRENKNFFHYQLSTKAKIWEHEQEVRLFVLNLHPTYMALLPHQDDKDGPIDWKEVRAFPKIEGDCFESVYLGINLKADEKSKIMDVAKKLNENIKIYQMIIDPNAFRLKEKLIFG